MPELGVYWNNSSRIHHQSTSDHVQICTFTNLNHATAGPEPSHGARRIYLLRSGIHAHLLHLGETGQHLTLEQNSSVTVCLKVDPDVVFLRLVVDKLYPSLGHRHRHTVRLKVPAENPSTIGHERQNAGQNETSPVEQSLSARRYNLFGAPPTRETNSAGKACCCKVQCDMMRALHKVIYRFHVSISNH